MYLNGVSQKQSNQLTYYWLNQYIIKFVLSREKSYAFKKKSRGNNNDNYRFAEQIYSIDKLSIV